MWYMFIEKKRGKLRVIFLLFFFFFFFLNLTLTRTHCLLTVTTVVYQFMMDNVINPLVVVERHNEAVFFPFYNEGERKHKDNMKSQ